MNEIKHEKGPDDNTGAKKHDGSAGGTQPKPRPPFPLMDISHTLRAKVTTHNPQQHSGQDNRTRCQKFYDWIFSIEPGDVILAVVAVVAVIIAILQNTLIEKANSTSAQALSKVEQTNEIATTNTGYTKQSADAATKAVNMAKKGEETTKKTAEAIQATAEANRSTANATKDVAAATRTVAQENAKTAKATEQVAAIADRALKASLDATAIAQRAASAAETAADATVESNRIAKQTAQEQLRAYVTVVMEPRPPFVVSADGYEFEMRMRLRNSGQTPAKNITVRTETYVRHENEQQGIDPRTLKALNGAGMTIGPGGEWPLFLGHVPRSDDRSRRQGGIACVLGRVEYEDVFGGKRFTNFFLFEGPLVKSTRNQFEPIYANSWNDSN